MEPGKDSEKNKKKKESGESQKRAMCGVMTQTEEIIFRGLCRVWRQEEGKEAKGTNDSHF